MITWENIHFVALLKVFGTIGGAIEYVFHNRKWLFSIGKAIKGVF
jgi:hypothetical protein